MGKNIEFECPKCHHFVDVHIPDDSEGDISCPKCGKGYSYSGDSNSLETDDEEHDISGTKIYYEE